MPSTQLATGFVFAAEQPPQFQGGQLPRVIRVRPADHHHRVHPRQQLLQRPLVVAGRLAGGVHEPDLGVRVLSLDPRPDLGRRARGGRGLADHPEPRVRVRIGRSRFAARARVVNARTEAALVARVRGASERKYGWGRRPRGRADPRTGYVRTAPSSTVFRSRAAAMSARM